MQNETFPTKDHSPLSRRQAMRTLGAAAGMAAFAGRALAQAAAQTGTPPSVISSPPRDFGPNGAPDVYPDPDIITVDPDFNTLRVNNTAIKRLFTGADWSEGPAWSSQGRFLVWSDIPNDRQLRYIEDDGRVSVFRKSSNNSNGNLFDHQGRQVSCEHRGHRVVRYEHDGSVTVIADAYQGKHLNAPNDVAAHIDGSYWFTDPPFGSSLYESAPEAPGGIRNPGTPLNGKLGQPPGVGALKGELPGNIYRAEPGGRVEMLISEQDLGAPGNGIAFSPDYKKVYIVSQGVVWSFDISADGKKISNKKQFANFVIDGVTCRTDGVRVDVFGNLWCGSNAGASLGYSGVTVWNSSGKLLGRIRLPESCANLTFGGPKRNRLFMAAGQSLYAVYVNTQGAAPS